MTPEEFKMLCERAEKEGAKAGTENKRLSDAGVETEYGLPHEFCYNGAGKFYWEAYTKARFPKL